MLTECKKKSNNLFVLFYFKNNIFYKMQIAQKLKE